MLKVENLTCGYEKKAVISDISFRADSGEFIGIIGPNGSGKTTLLRALSRAITPMGGRIFWQDKDIRTIPVKELARDIAVVSQNSALNNLTVEEFILLGRIPYYGSLQFFETERDLGAARKAMDLTGVSEFKNRILSRMSGGEKQLVLIARALAQEPKLLLLDEPTTHLDIAHQVRLMDLIRRLNKKFGLTVIMVLHDLNLAGEYCRNLILVNKGAIYKNGSSEEVLNYRIIEEVYKTTVVVKENPVSAKPCCFLVSQEEKEKRLSLWKEKG